MSLDDGADWMVLTVSMESWQTLEQEPKYQKESLQKRQVRQRPWVERKKGQDPWGIVRFGIRTMYTRSHYLQDYKPQNLNQ